MAVLTVTIILFILLEVSNVILLYFQPGSKLGNGVGVFKEWENSKANPNVHSFIKYLTNWVAGTKLIFIMLLVVILISGSDLTKILTAVVLIFSIATYYWRLHPIIKDLDEKGEIHPKGYSKTLGKMIGVFILTFLVAFIYSIINYL